MGWILPAISIGAGLLGAKKQSDAAGQQKKAMGQQQRIIDEILNESRRRRDEQAPIRSASQSRFMELLGGELPAFDPGQFRDAGNPFRANFGTTGPVGGRAALAMPTPATPSAAAPSSPFHGNSAFDKLRKLMGKSPAPTGPAPGSTVDPAMMAKVHEMLASIEGNSKIPGGIREKMLARLRQRAGDAGALPR